MIRLLSCALLAGAALIASTPAAAQSAADVEAKIRNARSAAPAAISADATVLDWPATEGAAPATLRQGSNGWTCMPHMPGMQGNAPMCVDQTWMNFMHAVMTRTAPRVDRVGIGYMIAPGGAYASNTDPYARGPAPGNEWGFDPPHLMVVVPDPATLKGLPTTRTTAGPWVMFAGTPYAHIMIPIEVPRR